MMPIEFKCSCGQTFPSKREVNAHAAAQTSGVHEGAMVITPTYDGMRGAIVPLPPVPPRALTGENGDDDVMAEIERQLMWRGPNGGKQGHIVLTRAQAETIFVFIHGLADRLNQAADES